MKQYFGGFLALMVAFIYREEHLKCEAESRILTITAKSYLTELYVDDIKIGSLTNEDNWLLSDDVDLSNDSRLISVVATDTSYTCGGILASVSDDFLVSDATWKCSTNNLPGWYALGFDDSSWNNAHAIGFNGNVTTPTECNVLEEIPSISSSASWIWTDSIQDAPEHDAIIFCRGYLPYCELESPCQNGGTCNRNQPELCSCRIGFIGKYCETATNLILTITAKSYLIELYVDNRRIRNLTREDVWILPDNVALSPDSRLLSVAATDISSSCGGILASVTGDILVTDATWKCTSDNIPGWFALGFDDSSWSDAHVIGINGNVTTPDACSVLVEIPSISSKASWIWTDSIVNAPDYDATVFCRSYLQACDDAQCQNGGTCNNNGIDLCTCALGYSGIYCEQAYPLNSAVLVGNQVFLTCKRNSTNVSWWFARSGNYILSLIASDCRVLPQYINQYAMDTEDNFCNLVINNAQLNHAGTYACQDTATDDIMTTSQLTVLDGAQECYSEPSVVYGQHLNITCQIRYDGNWVPTIRWTDPYGQAVTNATTQTTSSSVSSSIQIPGYFPSVPSFTSTAYFAESFLPDYPNDFPANNTPADSYAIATETAQVECPNGFTNTSNYHCYQFQSSWMSWSNARTNCSQTYPGAYLAVISDADEQSDISTFLNGYNVPALCSRDSEGNSGIWTSGRRSSDSCSSDYVWQPSSGVQIPLTYTNWELGEPDCGDGSEYCLELIHQKEHSWNDDLCNDNCCFLCEFELTPI